MTVESITWNGQPVTTATPVVLSPAAPVADVEITMAPAVGTATVDVDGLQVDVALQIGSGMVNAVTDLGTTLPSVSSAIVSTVGQTVTMRYTLT